MSHFAPSIWPVGWEIHSAGPRHAYRLDPRRSSDVLYRHNCERVDVPYRATRWLAKTATYRRLSGAYPRQSGV